MSEFILHDLLVKHLCLADFVFCKNLHLGCISSGNLSDDFTYDHGPAPDPDEAFFRGGEAEVCQCHLQLQNLPMLDNANHIGVG